jgi:hypothetical protein
MDFIMPCDCDIARLYGQRVSPKTLSVTVKRVHEGDDYATDFQIEFVGDDLVGAKNSDNWTTLEFGTALQTKLNGNLSAAYYQGVCNHALYDDLCKVDRAAHTTTAIVTKVQGQIITVDNDGVADNVLNAGDIVNTRTGEKQSILSNTANVVRIGYRFVDIIVGDEVELTKGCDHLRLGDCKITFNNVVNYGGTDFVPVKNPYETKQV